MTQTRKNRISQLLRARRDLIYNAKREHFEVEELFSGFLWWRKFEGWVVNVLRVEGSSCAAVGGSLGYIVPETISDVFPTKFGAYRWIVENIQDMDDVDFYIY